jgi:hypothetical protein
VPVFDIDSVEAYWGDDGFKIETLGVTTTLHTSTMSSGDSDVCTVFEMNMATQFQTNYQVRVDGGVS